MLPGVAALVADVRLEVLMDDGARLVVLLEPLGPAGDDAPGAIRQAATAVERPDGRDRIELEVAQHVDSGRPGLQPLPVRAGQPALEFDRRGRAGFRLDLAAGSTERWAPGETRTVGLVRVAVKRLSPAERLARYGPTTGDRVRLGDTDLWIRVERRSPGARRRADLGLRQDAPPAGDPGPRRPTRSSTPSIAGALVLDPVLGAVKADIGIKDGRIVGVGRAGNDADQRRHRAADRPAHPADHGLRPHRHARRGRQPRPPDLARSSCPRRCRAA